MDDKLLFHDASARGPIALATAQQAARIVDTSGLVERLEEWRAADAKGPGGRPPYFSMRSLLILWLCVALEKTTPMHVTKVSEVVVSRLKPKTAAVLGITVDPDADPDAMYERVRAGTARIFSLFDPEPLSTRHRKLTKAEYQRELDWREQHKVVLDKKRSRQRVFHNAWLEATYQLLPKRLRTDKISIAIDATRLPVFAKGIGKKKLAKLASDKRVSIEPDAGFYLRTSKGKEPEPGSKEQVKISEYALEAEFSVLTSNDPTVPDAVPNIVLAFATHVPGKAAIHAGRQMVENLYERGHEVDHLAADSLYMPGANAEDFQNPLRRRGIKLVMDYVEKFQGYKTTAHGALMVEGTFYSPGMPTELINATKNYHAALKKRGMTATDEDAAQDTASRAEQRARLKATWKQQLAEREKYELRRKEKPDQRGYYPMTCPAAGTGATVTCELKPATNSKAKGRVLLPILNVPKAQGAICQNKTSTRFHIDDGGKYAQHYTFGSEQWERHYHHARNNVESMNAYVKDESTFALAAPGRRRLRGTTAQSALMVITVAAANISKIREFLMREREIAGADAEVREAPGARTRGYRRSRKSTATARIAHRERAARRRRPVESEVLRT